VHVIRKVAAGEPATPDAHRELVARYERLRADALDGAGQGWRWGRALLQRHGVAVWIDTWQQLCAPAPVRPSPATAVAVPAASEQLVAVLAAMALAITTRAAGGCP
jgi:hypothetical protein